MENELIITSIKELLQTIIDSAKGLPQSECDSPIPYGDTGYTQTFRSTVDFQKGKSLCARVVMEFIDACLDDMNKI